MGDSFKLTSKEKKFCEEFLRTGKRAESARAAGYSQKSAGTLAARLLKKEKCLAYIRQLQEQARAELGIDNNWTVLRAVEIYNRCMQSVPVTEWSKEERRYVETGEYTFDCKGALKALELIKSLLGLGEEDSGKLMAAVTFIDDVK